MGPHGGRRCSPYHELVWPIDPGDKAYWETEILASWMGARERGKRCTQQYVDNN